MSTYVDAAATVYAWVNGLTGTLVGAGRPLQLGASYKVHSGVATVAYGVIVELPGFLWGGAEHPSMGARVSMQIYGPTKEAASVAATAYAEALLPLLQGVRATVTLASGQVVTIAGVGSVDGPQWIPDGDEPRYVVDADFLFA